MFLSLSLSATTVHCHLLPEKQERAGLRFHCSVTAGWSPFPQLCSEPCPAQKHLAQDKKDEERIGFFMSVLPDQSQVCLAAALRTFSNQNTVCVSLNLYTSKNSLISC